MVSTGSKLASQGASVLLQLAGGGAGKVEEIALQGDILRLAGEAMCGVVGSAFRAVPVSGGNLLQAYTAQVKGLAAVITNNAGAVVRWDVLTAVMTRSSFQNKLMRA